MADKNKADIPTIAVKFFTAHKVYVIFTVIQVPDTSNIDALVFLCCTFRSILDVLF